MGARTWLAGAIVLSLLLPLSQAASADVLDVAGTGLARGAPDAVFVVADARGLTWSATASSILLTHTSENRTTVDPLHRADPVYALDRDAQSSTESFSAGSLLGLASRAGGAMLVEGAGGPPSGVAEFRTAQVALATDPRLEEHPATVENAPPSFLVSRDLSGAFVNITAEDADYVLQGNLVVTIFDVDYLLQAGGQSLEERTGHSVLADQAGVRQERVEQQRLVLVNATLRLHAPGPATFLATAPTLDFQGTLTATGVQGSLARPGLDLVGTLASGASQYRGSGALRLAPEGGALAIQDAPAPSFSVATSTSDSGLFLVVALGAVLAIGGTAYALNRKRRRDEDDTAAALVAMEERRFADALAPLGRALARRPHDALLHLDLALCLEETGDRAGARRAYEATLRLAPANAEALYYYARCLARMREEGLSAAHLNEALALDPRLEDMARSEAAFRGFTGVAP